MNYKAATRLKRKRYHIRRAVLVSIPAEVPRYGSARFNVEKADNDEFGIILTDHDQQIKLEMQLPWKVLRDGDIVSRNQVYKKVQKKLWKRFVSAVKRETMIELWCTLWGLKELPTQLAFEPDTDDTYTAIETEPILLAATRNIARRDRFGRKAKKATEDDDMEAETEAEETPEMVLKINRTSLRKVQPITLNDIMGGKVQTVEDADTEDTEDEEGDDS